jgi:hypothetical protein
MVIRVVLSLSFLILTLSVICISDATAMGPSCYPPQTYAQAPCPTYRAPCGGPPPPLALCSGILAACSSICGACLGCPAAIMRIILAPPPAPCRPRRCGPMWMPPPPMYTQTFAAPPPPAPRRIAKCAPATTRLSYPPVSYAAPPQPPVPVCTPQAPCGRWGCPLLRQGSLDGDDMPEFRLASGFLVPTPRVFSSAYADASVTGGQSPSDLRW